MLIQRLIHEPVRAIVVLPGDVLKDDVREAHGEFLDLLHERLERSHLHPVFAVQLPHDQFGVEVGDEPIRMIAFRDLESFDQRPVFRDVVRFDADPFIVLPENFFLPWGLPESPRQPPVRGFHGNRRP